MSHTRRAFLSATAASGVGLLTFSIAGCESKVTPAQARAAGADFRTLQAAEVATLDALGEILLPGSAANGLSHFIDHQLSGDPSQSMLMIKYLRVPAPFTGFYRAGLLATEAAAKDEFGTSMARPHRGARQRARRQDGGRNACHVERPSRAVLLLRPAQRRR